MSESKKDKKGSLGLLVILGKSSKLLKVLKFFKVAKPLVLLISMSLSAIAYAFLLGPWLAILLVLLILIHEMGHVVAMKIKGFDTPTPIFIPFLGAAIFAPKFKDRDTEAYVGYGGPFLGTIGTLLLFVAWFFIPENTAMSHIVIVACYLGTYLNLFNLLPISPLDGGRITQAVGPWFKYIGFIMLLAFSLLIRQPVILYIWVIVLYEFESMPLKLRGMLTASCWIAMAALMSLGYGEQPTWLNIFDCVLTFPFMYAAVRGAIQNEDTVDKDDRPALASGDRSRWLFLYFVISLVLVSLIFIQFPLLPKRA